MGDHDGGDTKLALNLTNGLTELSSKVTIDITEWLVQQ